MDRSNIHCAKGKHFRTIVLVFNRRKSCLNPKVSIKPYNLKNLLQALEQIKPININHIGEKKDTTIDSDYIL
jgi:hypothetical protein